MRLYPPVRGPVFLRHPRTAEALFFLWTVSWKAAVCPRCRGCSVRNQFPLVDFLFEPGQRYPRKSFTFWVSSSCFCFNSNSSITVFYHIFSNRKKPGKGPSIVPVNGKMAIGWFLEAETKRLNRHPTDMTHLLLKIPYIAVIIDAQLSTRKEST